MRLIGSLIGSRTHGMMDYPMGALMMSTPFLMRMDRKEVATWIPVALGASMAALAAMTNFEAGVKRKIPFRTHLMIDMISGAALALSPLLLRSRGRTWIPHLVFGLSELATALLTKPEIESQSGAQGGPRPGAGRPSSSSRSKSRRSSSRSSSGSSSSSSDGSSNGSSNGSSSRSRSRSGGNRSSARSSSRRRSESTTEA